ncbi:MAG: hypothetical protein V1779_06970 [bacterium]
MQAIEFDTYISQNRIQIPLDFNYLNNIKAKVSIQIEDNLLQGNFDKRALIEAFNKAKRNDVFKEIENSILWQQDFRNEWE